MSWISWICFGICFAIILSVFRREADPLSPARVFGFVWSFSIGLTDLKLSAFQQIWNLDSWSLLLIAVTAFLVGTFIAYVLNLKRELIPIPMMRQLLLQENIRESRLFGLICLSILVYIIAFFINFLVKGWLPFFTIGTSLTRVEFNVSGLTLFLYTVSFIIFFTVLYNIQVKGKKNRKIFLTIICLIAVGSNLLLLSRYQIIMAIIFCFPMIYYATHHIRLKTAIPLLLMVTTFFYWISSIRVSRFVTTFIYSISKMKFSKDYAFFTEPYMYCVMNLENFARSVNQLDYHTYGYFTFDFVTAIAGLKYWIVDYFSLERMPYIISGYNTYTAFWWFYCDFGVLGLALIPWILGFIAGLLYYRMRSNPTIKNVTAYGVMIFIMLFSFFNFPISFLWFEYNLLMIYLFLRWVMIPRKVYS